MSGLVLFNTAASFLSAVLLVFLILASFGRKREDELVRYFHAGLLFLLLALFIGEAGECLTSELCGQKQMDKEMLVKLTLLFSGIFASFSNISFSFYICGGTEKKGAERLPVRLIAILTALYIPAELLLDFEGGVYPIFGAIQLFISFMYIILSLGHENRRLWLGAAVMLPIFLHVLEMMIPYLRLTAFGMTLMYQIAYMNYQVQTENELMQRDIELADTKVRLLMQQISPHFIFNSLQVIQGLCDDEPEKVKPAIAHFSEYLRGNLESLTANELIPFKREMEHTGEYIKLEQLSDGREFEVEYRLGAEDFMMPPLILQPIVENAIRYGIGTHSVGGRIVVETEEDAYQVVIRVSDDGQGDDHSTEKQKNRQSVGLKNVRGRLAAQCGGRLIIDKREDGTTVSVIMPKK